ncbi:MAG: 23S rRNA (adenine(2503)-C(2))-methyltransferase RlmN [Elusimicrobiaceae bacterium]|nr:23S rRNA (adenine(2503)-C(2))-methyltransferase RlmN [Elusimicrobiaceae bacterium]MBT4440193.1 23S rRNA (adenine(2503)-C(2))-methyltransferase RlmN [Elusimicrobiaceae bacterium]MBT7283597.1 23S rRNA (adenine(2503)-C(2))-methyltransferase RlmN [Elusimicrobiaceae bacterium]
MILTFLEEKINIMDFEKLKKFIKNNDIPSYRINQIRDAIYKQGITNWDDIKQLPANLRKELAVKQPILSVFMSKIQQSKRDKIIKALLTLKDGYKIETVLIKPYDSWSVCVSTQVGCQIGCTFCQTGHMGFKRDLTAEEISDQVLFWQGYLRSKKIDERISSVVYMGMGEPLLNYDEVVKSIKTLSDTDFLNIGQRHISISTSGIADKIKKLATDLPQVKLALSLHYTDDKLRSKIMPINRKFNLQSLQLALEDYIARTNRQVFIEYILIQGVNDSTKDFRKLVKWIEGIRGNYLLHVNVIPANQTKKLNNKITNAEVDDFVKSLKKANISASARKSLGADINAACGQLATK